MKLGLTGQHTSALHIVKDDTGRTVCGRQAWSVSAEQPDDRSKVDCKTCVRVRFGRDLRVEVYEDVVSHEAEECQYADEEGHQADGNGPDCDGECKSLEGDYRTVEGPSETVHDYDAEEGSPLDWATKLIDDEVASMSSDFLEPSVYPVPDVLSAHAWVSGRYTNPATGHETRYSVRLTGDWTPRERAIVFQSVTNMRKL